MGKKSDRRTTTKIIIASYPEFTKFIINKNYSAAVKLLNTIEALVFDDSIPLIEYLKLLSGYSLNDKPIPRTLEETYPLVPGISLTPLVKKKLLDYLLIRISKNIMNSIDQMILSQWAMLSGSLTLIHAILMNPSSEAYPQNIIADQLTHSPFEISCDNVGFTNDLIENLTPVQTEAHTLNDVICSERSPLYYFKKTASNAFTLKEKKILEELISKTMETPLQYDHYSHRALFEYYTVLTQLITTEFSIKITVNYTRIVTHKNMIEAHLKTQDANKIVTTIIQSEDPLLLDFILAKKLIILDEPLRKFSKQLIQLALSPCIISHIAALKALLLAYPDDFYAVILEDSKQINLKKLPLDFIETFTEKAISNKQQDILMLLIKLNRITIKDLVVSFHHKKYSLSFIKELTQKLTPPSLRFAAISILLDTYGVSTKEALLPEIDELLKNKELPLELTVQFVSWVDPKNHEQLPWDEFSKSKIGSIARISPALKLLSDAALAARTQKKSLKQYLFEEKNQKELSEKNGDKELPLDREAVKPVLERTLPPSLIPALPESSPARSDSSGFSSTTPIHSPIPIQVSPPPIDPTDPKHIYECIKRKIEKKAPKDKRTFFPRDISLFLDALKIPDSLCQSQTLVITGSQVNTGATTYDPKKDIDIEWAIQLKTLSSKDDIIETIHTSLTSQGAIKKCLSRALQYTITINRIPLDITILTAPETQEELMLRSFVCRILNNTVLWDWHRNQVMGYKNPQLNFAYSYNLRQEDYSYALYTLTRYPELELHGDFKKCMRNFFQSEIGNRAILYTPTIELFKKQLAKKGLDHSDSHTQTLLEKIKLRISEAPEVTFSGSPKIFKPVREAPLGYTGKTSPAKLT